MGWGLSRSPHRDYVRRELEYGDQGTVYHDTAALGRIVTTLTGEPPKMSPGPPNGVPAPQDVPCPGEGTEQGEGCWLWGLSHCRSACWVTVTWLRVIGVEGGGWT